MVVKGIFLYRCITIAGNKMRIIFKMNNLTWIL